MQFNSIEDKIFKEYKGKLYIGKNLIKPELQNILREQAIYLQTSQIYEILLATLKGEAVDLALIQSKDWDSVQFAKALWHVTFVFENLINTLRQQ